MNNQAILLIRFNRLAIALKGNCVQDNIMHGSYATLYCSICGKSFLSFCHNYVLIAHPYKDTGIGHDISFNNLKQNHCNNCGMLKSL